MSSSSSSLSRLYDGIYIMQPNMERHFAVFRDFPKSGVTFRSLFPALHTNEWNEFVTRVDNMLSLRSVMAGIDSRGYLVAGALAMSRPIISITKPGKLPESEVESIEYKKEYGTDRLECLKLEKYYAKYYTEQKPHVYICDDLLATGGSALAAASLLERQGCEIAGFIFAGIVPECQTPTSGVSLIRQAYPRAKLITGCVFEMSEPKPTSEIPEIPKTSKPKTEVWERYERIPAIIKIPHKMMLVAHPSMEAWSHRLLRLFPNVFEELRVTWARFSDSSSDLALQIQTPMLYGRRILYIMSSTDAHEFEEQSTLLTVLPRHEIESLEVWMPYLSGATYERCETRNLIASSELRIKKLSSAIPGTRCGPPSMLIADIHALQEEFYFQDSLRYVRASGIPMLLELLRDPKKCDSGSVKSVIIFPDDPFKRFRALVGTEYPVRSVIIFPDDGAFKRFRALVGTEYPIVVLNKQRQGDKRKLSIGDYHNWPKGLNLAGVSHGIIVDDLVLSGGTLLEAAKLPEFKHMTLDCYATHGRFPNESYKKFQVKGDSGNFPFKTMYVTNSIHNYVREPLVQLPLDLSLFYSRLPLWLRVCGSETWGQMPMMRVHLASKSPVKILAVKSAYEFLFPQHPVEILTYDVPSNVPSQPIGYEETMTGAHNRLSGVLNASSHTSCDVKIDDICDTYISMEDGIDCESDVAFNFSAVMFRNSAICESICSEKVPIDKNDYVAAQENCGRVTVGSMIYGRLKDCGSPLLGVVTPDDWFLAHYYCSRAQVLKVALIKLLLMSDVLR